MKKEYLITLLTFNTKKIFDNFFIRMKHLENKNSERFEILNEKKNKINMKFLAFSYQLKYRYYYLLS